MMPNSTTPLVSIAMCTYNGERFLQKQLDSLLEQDYPHLEIIISDDDSSDQTQQILQDFQKRCPAAKVLINPQNMGIVKNFENALKACQGEYISLCDQDDIWFPNKISTLMQNMGDATLIYTPTEMIDEHDTVLNKNFFETRNIQPVSGKCNKALIFDNCILGHCTIFKRSLLEHILPIPAGIKAHDQWISIIAATVGEIKLHNQILSYYREHATNVSLKKMKQKGLLFSIQRKWERAARLRRKHHSLHQLLGNLSQLECMPEKDRALIRDLHTKNARFFHVFYNRKLADIIKQEEEELLAICSNKPKALKTISRGFLANLLR